MTRSHVGSSPSPRARIAPKYEREAQHVGPRRSLTGDVLPVAVTNAMVAFHKRYYHRAPVTATTLLLDDELLVCVLGGVYTDVEKTMIELQRTNTVQDTPNAFQTTIAAQVHQCRPRSVRPRRPAFHLKTARRTRYGSLTLLTEP
jgi:hypothetical protein